MSIKEKVALGLSLATWSVTLSAPSYAATFALPASSFTYSGSGSGVISGGGGPFTSLTGGYSFLAPGGPAVAVSPTVPVFTAGSSYDSVTLTYTYAYLTTSSNSNVAIFLTNTVSGDLSQVAFFIADDAQGDVPADLVVDVTDFFNTSLASNPADNLTLTFNTLGTAGSFGFNNVFFTFTTAQPVPEPSMMFGLLTFGAVATGKRLKGKLKGKLNAAMPQKHR
ncbi:hypothetical protein [Anthocerotibacter panamensis]|uniref:hypothetical protein n=1 Tax=Anthocerotibacter panamensis TaxID=2857077 RepID=UPI001C406D5D|nr:hypothetical protein [Anthocerotibacter panamensis]